MKFFCQYKNSVFESQFLKLNFKQTFIDTFTKRMRYIRDKELNLVNQIRPSNTGGN